jgi:hypothetical protein
MAKNFPRTGKKVRPKTTVKHPQSEIALWFRITKAWLAYHEDFLGHKTLPNEEERKVLGALIAISAGIEDVSKLQVPAEVGRRLFRCYEDPAN